MKVTVQISNRHVHLTKEAYEKLFGDTDIEVKRYLNQKGEFSSCSKVDLEYNGKRIENVRVVGPFRKYNQVELLKSDLDYLGIDEKVRKSSDVKDTPGITIINGNNKVEITEGVIRQQRHIHMNEEEAKKLNLVDDEEIIVNDTFNAFVKVSENAYFELHIDKDEAEEFNLASGDEVEFKKL